MTTHFSLTNATVEVFPPDETTSDITVLYLVEAHGDGRIALCVKATNAQGLLAIAAVLRATAEQHGATETGEDTRKEGAS